MKNRINFLKLVKDTYQDCKSDSSAVSFLFIRHFIEPFLTVAPFIVACNSPFASRCLCLDELILPLCLHLAPRLSDELVLGVLGAAAKRLEASIKKVSTARHSIDNFAAVLDGGSFTC